MIEQVRRTVIANYDTTTPEGCRAAATDLRLRSLRAIKYSDAYWALVELARAFDLLGISYQSDDRELRIRAGKHLANAREWGRAA
jgi:hypothetical protein